MITALCMIIYFIVGFIVAFIINTKYSPRIGLGVDDNDLCFDIGQAVILTPIFPVVLLVWAICMVGKRIFKKEKSYADFVKKIQSW